MKPSSTCTVEINELLLRIRNNEISVSELTRSQIAAYWVCPFLRFLWHHVTSLWHHVLVTIVGFSITVFYYLTTLYWLILCTNYVRINDTHTTKTATVHNCNAAIEWLKQGEAVCCYVRVGVRVRVTVIEAGSTWRGEAVCCYVRVGVRVRVTVIEAGSTWRVVRRSAAMSGSVSGSGLVNEAGSTWSMVRRSAAMSGSVSGSGLQWLKQGRHEAWWGGLLLCQGRCQGVTVIEAGSTWSVVRRSAAMSGSVSGSGLQWLKQGRHEAWWGGLLLCQGRCQGQGYSDWSRVDMKHGEAVCCYVRVGVRVRVTVIEAGSTWSVVRRSAAMSGSVSGSGLQWLKQGRHEAWWGGLLLCQGRCQGQGYSAWSRVDMKHGEAVCCYVRVGVRVRVTVIVAGSTWRGWGGLLLCQGRCQGQGYSDCSRVDMKRVRRSAAMSGSVSGSGLQWLKQGRHEAWWGGLLLCQGRCQGQGYSDCSRVDMKRVRRSAAMSGSVSGSGLQWLKQGRHEAWWGGLLLCQGRCQGVTVIEAGSTWSMVRRSAAMSGSVSGSGLQWL